MSDTTTNDSQKLEIASGSSDSEQQQKTELFPKKRGRPPKKRITATLNEEVLEKRLIAEASLEEFAKLVLPKRVIGDIHRRVIEWWERPEAKDNQIVLLPRDHGKSAWVAIRAAYHLTKDPTTRILLISSTSNLAIKQLKFIKDILVSDNYRKFWPEMVEKEEAKREKWSEREISVDHPLRKEESIRDPSIFTAGLTTNIVGMHADIIILDDVVVHANAYTEEGREKVKEQYGYLSSIAGTNARMWVVGTRYHPKDLYADLLQMEIEEYDNEGVASNRFPLFESLEFAVESVGDGSGQYLWPRQQRYDGKWFGFDQDILAKKRAQYLNKTHFRAQYYNDPHDTDSSVFKREFFQYYEPGYLSRKDGRWYFKGRLLNVVAAVDFAYTLGKRSDFTAVVVIGVDGEQNFYILDIDRFKTDQPSDYFKHILTLHEKWGFRKIRAEVTGAQLSIVNGMKENYIRPLGLSLSIEEFKPTRSLGAKEDRILAVLEPKYNNRQVWHFHGGYCQTLEEELMYVNPPHDDVKDATASAIDFASGQSPLNIFRQHKTMQPTFQFHTRFGGVR